MYIIINQNTSLYQISKLTLFLKIYIAKYITINISNKNKITAIKIHIINLI